MGGVFYLGEKDSIMEKHYASFLSFLPSFLPFFKDFIYLF